MECSEGCPREYHRENDGRAMTGAQAYGAWVPVAKEILTELAQAQSNPVSYGNLAAVVQERSGISAGLVPVAEWMGRVLTQVSTMPDGADLMRLVQTPAGNAKPKRTRTTGAKPASVNKPASEKQSTASRPAKGKPKAEDAEPTFCPIHFLQLSASGQCGECE